MAVIFLHNIFIVVIWILYVNGAPPSTTPPTAQETCVLSLTIPKDSIKSSCNMNEEVVRKMHSMEVQFNHYRNQGGALDIRMQEIALKMNRYNDKVEQLELVIAKESTYSKHMDERVKSLEEAVVKEENTNSVKHITEPDTLLDPLRPHIMAELHQMKDDLRKEILNEIAKEKGEKMTKEAILSSIKPLLLAEMQYVKQEILKSLKDTVTIRILDQNEEIGSSDETGNHIVEDVKQPPKEQLNMVSDQGVEKDLSSLHDMARTLHTIEKSNVSLISSTENVETLENLTKSFESDTTEDEDNQKQSENSIILRENLQKAVEILQNVAKENVAKDINDKIDKISAHLEKRIDLIVSKLNEKSLMLEDTAKKLEISLEEISQNFSLQNQKINEQAKSLNSSEKIQQMNETMFKMKFDIQSMDRRIDGYTNDIVLDSKIQTKVENIRSSLDFSLTLMKSTLENKLEQVERQGNLSSTLLKHFQKTLMNNHNETDVNFENMKSEMSEIEHRLTEEMSKKMNTKVLEMRLEGLETDVMFVKNNIKNLQTNSTMEDTKLGIKISELSSKTQSMDWQLTSLHDHAQRILEIERNQTLLKNNYDVLREVMKLVHLEQKLKHDRWIEFNFTHHSTQNACHNKQYVKRNHISQNGLGAYVGVQLCSPTRYKLFLGNSLDEDFLDIGDQYGHGQDHCQFIGGQSENGVIVDTKFPSAMGEKAFMRKQWDDKPHIGYLSFMTPTPSWYECGISLP